MNAKVLSLVQKNKTGSAYAGPVLHLVRVRPLVARTLRRGQAVYLLFPAFVHYTYQRYVVGQAEIAE